MICIIQALVMRGLHNNIRCNIISESTGDVRMAIWPNVPMPQNYIIGGKVRKMETCINHTE